MSLRRPAACMTLTLAALLAGLAPGLARAAWTELGGNEQLTFFADFDAIEKTADGLVIWTLIDARQPRSHDGKTFQSVRSQFELQCAGPRIRERETRFHPRLQGEGEAVAGYRVEDPVWEAIVPETVKDALAQRACQAGGTRL